MKKKDAEDCVELCPHQCVEMERYCVDVTWKNSLKIFWAPAVSQGSNSSTINTESIKYRAVSALSLSAETAWQPPWAGSWLSPVSYCMLHFLAAFPNGFHLSVLLVLLVDHCKYLSSVGETWTHMNLFSCRG